MQKANARIASRKILPIGTILPPCFSPVFLVWRKLSVDFTWFPKTTTELPFPAQRSTIFREASGSGGGGLITAAFRWFWLVGEVLSRWRFFLSITGFLSKKEKWSVSSCPSAHSLPL
jgi:hypothetical protein